MLMPYLVFNGYCKEVMEFYEDVFNTKAVMMLHYESYVPNGLIEIPDNLNEWTLHAQMNIYGNEFWFTDEVEEIIKGNNIKLTLSLPTKESALKIYNKLCFDAQIILSPTQTFYSNFHAGLVDKFGVSWNLVSEEPASLD